MKTFYKKFFITLIVIVSSIAYIQAQICVNPTVTLEPDGTYELDPSQILNFQLQPDQSAFVIPNFFTCDNLYASTPATVYLIDNGDTTNLCTQDVIVQDSTPPVAKCKSSIHVQLNENGEYNFILNDADDHSSDLCTEVTTYKFFPNKINCTDPNPMEVLMVVRDLAGNEDTCSVVVSYDNYTGPTDPIQCRDSLTYYFYGDGDENEPPILITPDKVLARGQYGCINNYSIELFDGAILKPDDYVTLDDTSSLITAVLTELESGEQCTTAIEVIPWYDDPCVTETFLMCDTRCHSTPFGDCASGHTEDDHIELPCDVYITDWCALYGIDPDPEFIEWYGYPGSLNAWPTRDGDFITDQVGAGSIFVGFWEQDIALPTGRQIIRTWTILNWCTQQAIDHVQNIYVLYDLTDVCDTLPWNTPIGDCQSGHTLSDDVEWPADITIHSFFSHPDDLALNPEVQMENVRPRIQEDDCVVNQMAFQDVIIAINDTTTRIERTWEITDSISQNKWQYVQIITVIHEILGSTVCAATENGDPITGVELIPGVLTDNSGCHLFPNPEGIIVIPVKDSPIECGVNIVDLLILTEHLLGIHPISLYQQIAGDLSNSASVTAIDLVMFNQLLQGNYTSTWSHPWRFYEQTTHEGSANISDPLMPYKFIGVKIGDLDNSCLLNPDLEDIILRTEDDVLNAGEIYSIPFYLERNEIINGFAVRLKNQNNNIDFISVTSPNLPGFDSQNIVHAPDAITIQWISPTQNILNGVGIDTTEALFILLIRANENIILSEHLSLETTFDNLLKPTFDDPLEIRLSWEDIVISSVVELNNGRRIEFHPNPSNDVIHLKSLPAEEEGQIIILDALGKIAFEANMQGTLDISHLGVGMYYVVFVVDGERSEAAPLIRF